MRKNVKLETLDLTEFCRDSDKLVTNIQLNIDYQIKDWLRLGACEIVSHRDRSVWTIKSYFMNHTDGEHDSASVVRFEAVGLTFDMYLYGRTHISGYIKADDMDEFRVPTAGWDPYKGATPCKECKGEDKHKFVDYLPPKNPDLYELVRGCRFSLITGIKREEE